MNEFLEFWEEHCKTHHGDDRTDKGTDHDYIASYYAKEFSGKRDDKLAILEIGIGSGASLRLWTNYFRNAELFALEKYPYHYFHKEPFRLPGAKSIFRDAYSDEALNLFTDESLDYIIDDGPHTIESQLYVFENWFSKVKKGGKIIIEDVQDISHQYQFFHVADTKNIPCTINLHDFREKKNRWDDIIIEIIKL
jgi:hypothetical protein